MKIRTQSGGIMNPPQEVADIDSLVVTTDDDVPIAVALNIDNAVWIRTADETGFDEMMYELGFTKADIPKVRTVRPITGG